MGLRTTLEYRFLTARYPNGAGVPMPQHDPFELSGISKLATYFGEPVLERLRDLTVVDFGCGGGRNAIELAERGCARVIAIDTQEQLLDKGRRAAAERGLAGRVHFCTRYDGTADVVISTDAVEHFAQPELALRSMRAFLERGGYALVQFGPTWYHPFGGHLFSVFPWAHLLFTEEALIRWRQDFKQDGARRFGEVAGGLNQMTISRWERLVAASEFKLGEYDLVPIRRLARWHSRVTREWFTSMVVARLDVR